MKQIIHIPIGAVSLEGALAVPSGAGGIVIFAHPGSSCRHNGPDNQVASRLRHAGFGTLLFDLVSDEEEEHGARFDAEFLAGRLIEASVWVRCQPSLADLGIGYFGTEIGAAAALMAAARLGPRVRAVVCRDARTDLACAALPTLRAPTLLLNSGEDSGLLALNRQAYDLLPEPKALRPIVSSDGAGITHDIPDEIAKLAADWFASYIVDVEDPGV